MSRPRRLASSGVLHHIIARSNGASSPLESDDEYRSLLSLIVKYKARYCLNVYAYVLLPTHIHLLISSALDGGVPRAMREILTNFTKWYNARHHRQGCFWQSRYRSVVVEDGDPVLASMFYLDRHPLESGLSRKPGEYRWSSYGYYARCWRDPLVDPYDGYLELGADGKERARRYRILCNSQARAFGECGREPLTTAVAFGSSAFVRKVLPQIGVGRREGSGRAGLGGSSGYGGIEDLSRANSHLPVTKGG